MSSHWKLFLKLCLKTHDAEALSKLLDCFLTHEEINAITDRFSIIKALLEKKQTQREMSESLHVSIAKITRGSNAMKLIDPKLKVFLEKNIS